MDAVSLLDLLTKKGVHLVVKDGLIYWQEDSEPTQAEIEKIKALKPRLLELLPANDSDAAKTEASPAEAKRQLDEKTREMQEEAAPASGQWCANCRHWQDANCRKGVAPTIPEAIVFCPFFTKSNK
jgi:hypothetical protein